MIFDKMNTVSQGSVGLGLAIAHFTIEGFTVNVPLNDNQDYDLVVEKNGTLKRVQVKTTKYKVRGQKVYTVQLKRVRPNTKENKIKKFDATKNDWLFIVTEEQDKYLIPSLEVHDTNTLSLGKKVAKYKLGG